ncbi:MAG: hypothetical protein KIS66_12255 [Fimbriimonadaceae bacterium]|nr:hypothetical protein [Fimbriimonadaceae bacterium]
MPKNLWIRIGVLVAVASALMWVAQELLQKVAQILIWTGCAGVALMAIGMVLELRGNKAKAIAGSDAKAVSGGDKPVE